ncbi:MAG: outer membrane porin, OprD family, partial [Campylobacterales bacterium]|nr:outer membrane porin, OprD family [Campylobacterales bacterium]
MKIYSSLLSILFLSSCLNAQTSEEKRDDSVREAVYGNGKLEQKEITVVDNFKRMFKEGQVSGQLRVSYASYNFQNTDPDVYATAIGGILKYELAQYNGFNAGVAFYASKDIAALSADEEHRNTELSSSTGEDVSLGEAYINYKYNDLNLKVGRQVLDTPLADSDDIRMIQNTFEAYTLSYELGGWNFLAGNIQSWHGIDLQNGLDDGWRDIGDNGVNFVGAKYYDMWEFQSWYYNITGITNAIYLDFGVEYLFSDQLTLHIMAQYLNEQELKGSGYGANIYGGLFELVLGDLGLNLAYNHADKKSDQESFSGTGGGTLFTSMDMMI